MLGAAFPGSHPHACVYHYIRYSVTWKVGPTLPVFKVCHSACNTVCGRQTAWQPSCHQQLASCRCSPNHEGKTSSPTANCVCLFYCVLRSVMLASRQYSFRCLYLMIIPRNGPTFPPGRSPALLYARGSPDDDRLLTLPILLTFPGPDFVIMAVNLPCLRKKLNINLATIADNRGGVFRESTGHVYTTSSSSITTHSPIISCSFF